MAHIVVVDGQLLRFRQWENQPLKIGRLKIRKFAYQTWLDLAIIFALFVERTPAVGILNIK